jgi:DNA-binding HxlR family transcriptional regulator
VFTPALGAGDSPAAVAIEFLGRKWTRTIVEVLLDEGSLR